MILPACGWTFPASSGCFDHQPTSGDDLGEIILTGFVGSAGIARLGPTSLLVFTGGDRLLGGLVGAPPGERDAHRDDPYP
jgi:hypothetical protein